MTEPEQRTRIAAYCVCVRDDAILLVRLNERTASPGHWTLPGGGVDFGEEPERAAVRELEEETGLRGSVVDLLGVQSLRRTILEPELGMIDYHAIRIVYRAEIAGGTLRDEPPGNSTDAATWHRLEALASVECVDLVRWALERLFDKR